MTEIEYICGGIIIISKEGVIVCILRNIERSMVEITVAGFPGYSSKDEFDFRYLEDGEFLLPGFVDTHTVSVCSAKDLNS